MTKFRFRQHAQELRAQADRSLSGEVVVTALRALAKIMDETADIVKEESLEYTENFDLAFESTVKHLQKLTEDCHDHVEISLAREVRSLTAGLGDGVLSARLVFSFSEKGFGFGEIAIHQEGNEVFLDTENMGLDKVRKFLHRFLDRAILDTDDDSVRHQRYNEVMGRRCCGGCEVCHPDPDSDKR